MGDRDPQVVKEGANEGIREVKCEIPGQGMFWEADECGRCVRDVSRSPFLSFPFPSLSSNFPPCSFSPLRFLFFQATSLSSEDLRVQRWKDLESDV